MWNRKRPESKIQSRTTQSSASKKNGWQSSSRKPKGDRKSSITGSKMKSTGRSSRKLCVLVDNVPSSEALNLPEFSSGDVVFDVARALFAELDTPVSLAQHLLLCAQEWAQLSTRKLSPSDYLDTPSGVERYRRDVQAVDFLRKYEDLPSAIDRRGKAISTFYTNERLCKEANAKLSLIRRYGPMAPVEHAWLRVVAKAKKWIARVLGPLPDELGFGFGPGTAVGLKHPTLMQKLITQGFVTAECAYLVPFLEQTDGWFRRLSASGLSPKVVSGGKFFTVPKDANAFRGCDLQPIFNLGLQLGVGRHMKYRLSSVGLHTLSREWSPQLDPVTGERSRYDLSDGQISHRGWALRGSVTGEYATIDLSSASDTVSYEIVRELLPPLWFTLLDTLRTPYTVLPNGRAVKLEKFSAMGNGFTFELETLIFASLVHGVTGLYPGTDFLVFGDDIVVPSESAADVLAVLEFAGFVPNRDKTFTSGFFRESCGGDYFLGHDVRAVYLKKKPSLASMYDLENQLVRRGLSKTAAVVRASVPQPLRRWVRPGMQGAFWEGGSPRLNFRDGMAFVQLVTTRWAKYGYGRFNFPPEVDHWKWLALAGSLGLESEGVTPRDPDFVEYVATWIGWA